MPGWYDEVPAAKRDKAGGGKAGGGKAGGSTAPGAADDVAKAEDASGGYAASIEELEKFERDIANLQKKLSNFGTKKDTTKFRDGALKTLLRFRSPNCHG